LTFACRVRHTLPGSWFCTTKRDTITEQRWMQDSNVFRPGTVAPHRTGASDGSPLHRLCRPNDLNPCAGC
jgi:hypothetical protein